MNVYKIKENELLFAKVKANAIIPSKKDEDAGYDIYANFDGSYMIIPPHETKLIPTGVASAMCDKYYLQVEERGSTGSKGIKKSAGVIDSSYRGEIFIAITNTNDKYIVISKDDKDEEFLSDEYIIYPCSKAIAQLVVHEVPKMNVHEIDYEDLINIPSNRGVGSLGSSNK